MSGKVVTQQIVVMQRGMEQKMVSRKAEMNTPALNKTILFQRKFLPYIVLFLCLLATLYAWHASSNHFKEMADQNFTLRADEITSQIVKGIDSNRTILRGGVALLAAQGEVSREQWHLYVESLRAENTNPGTQGFGFSKVIRLAELQAHIAEIRAEGFPHYTVHPEGRREEYTAIIYLEPFDERNQRAFGYDMFSEPVRHAAMEQARDTDRTTLSGEVELVQEGEKDVQSGFLMYVPVYKKGMPVATVTERRSALLGYVYSPFRIKDLMQEILGPPPQDIDIGIFDGSDMSETTLMYDSTEGTHEYSMTLHQQRLFVDKRVVDISGHQWTLYYTSLPTFEILYRRQFSLGILLSGLVISILLFLFIRSQENTREQALIVASDTTAALKKLEATQIAENEAREYSENIINTLREPLIILDQDLRVVTVSRSFYEIFQAKPEETVGQLIYDLGNKQWDIPKLRELLETILPQKTTFDNYEVEHDFTTIGRRIMLLNGRQIKQAWGKERIILLAIEDITERKRAEEALLESEGRYRVVFKESIHGILVVDLETGRFSYANPSTCRMFGYSETELLLLNIEDIHPADSLNLVRTKFDSVRDEGKALSPECPCLRKDGTVFYADIAAVGAIINGRKCIVGFFADVTERREIEAGLEMTRKELAATKLSEDAAHEYSESVIDTVREPLLALDSDLRVVKANRSFYHSFEVTPQGTIGNLIYDLGNRQWDIPKLRTLLEEILPKDNKFDDYEVEHNFLNIGHKIMLLNARRVTQKASGSQLILLAIEEVTDKITLQRQLAERTRDAEKAQSEAESANRAKSDFLANMSHELRTPLNSIIGFSEILEDGIAGPIADKQKELANDISTSGKHLLSLINDILDLAKVEAGKMELELGEFNLEEIIDGSLVMFKEKAMKHNLKVAAEVEAELGNIIADERKIKQVLFNLLSNALKFTPDGGAVRVSARRVQREEEKAAGRITLDAEPADFIEVCVADTGIGISEEDQKMLFQPFQQIDSALSRKYSGTGLGLNLCKKFVELHGGWIWVESEVDKGSKFVFSIPIKPTKVIL